MYAYSGTHWDVVSNQPALAGNPGSVKTYPNTQYDGSPNLLGKSPLSYGTLTSTFSTSTASRGEWNAAYDMWMNDHTEIMVWTSYAHLPSPYDDSVDVPVTFDGVQYYAFHYGANYVAFQRAKSATTGSVDLRAMFQWLVNRGWLSSSAALEDVEYGFEIHQTNGPEKFSVKGLSLSVS